MTDADRKYVESLVDTALKLRLMATLPDDFLRFVSEVELNPTPEAIAAIEKFNADMSAYLQKRVEYSRQSSHQPQPEMFVAARTFLN